jgi:hypothetical protein
MYLTVRKDGRSLHRYAFIVLTRCTDGKLRQQGLLHPGERRVAIDSAGRFSYRSAWQRGGYGRVRGRLRLSFSGAFDASGDTAGGTIRATFRARRFDCSSGPVEFTVHRDGTAGAPWRDPLMATGLYRARGRGVRARIRALAPGRTLVRMNLTYRAPCRRARALQLGHIFRDYAISERGRMGEAARISHRIPAEGVVVRGRFRVRMRFSGGANVSGRWRVNVRLYRAGRAIDRCRMNRSFRGSFVRGPA